MRRMKSQAAPGPIRAHGRCADSAVPLAGLPAQDENWGARRRIAGRPELRLRAGTDAGGVWGARPGRSSGRKRRPMVPKPILRRKVKAELTIAGASTRSGIFSQETVSGPNLTTVVSKKSHKVENPEVSVRLPRPDGPPLLEVHGKGS